MGPGIEEAAEAIRKATHLLIAAGAGMGVDSGLPDFRGPEGFWKAYPPYRRLGLDFYAMANPAGFARDPELAWGFYGHRLNLYRETTPHAGFTVLLEWAKRLDAPGEGAGGGGSAFVITSNVDGQFQQAGFSTNRIFEIHGSIHHLQCSRPCSQEIRPARDRRSSDGMTVRVDEKTMRALPPLPRCPTCGTVARPNILMFGDGAWISARSDDQRRRYREFLNNATGGNGAVGGRHGGLVIIELGAGTAVPSIRMESERLVRAGLARLVRINLREPEGPSGTISIAGGARDTLEAIAERLG